MTPVADLESGSLRRSGLDLESGCRRNEQIDRGTHVGNVGEGARDSTRVEERHAFGPNAPQDRRRRF